MRSLPNVWIEHNVFLEIVIVIKREQLRAFLTGRIVWKYEKCDELGESTTTALKITGF